MYKEARLKISGAVDRIRDAFGKVYKTNAESYLGKRRGGNWRSKEELPVSQPLEKQRKPEDIQKALSSEYARRMREMRGKTYEEAGFCNGSVLGPLKDMGYKIPDGITADSLAKGAIKGISPFRDVNDNRQGKAGGLNGYDWNTDGVIDHVNAGVGQLSGEIKEQVIDATSSDNTWTIGRNNGMPTNGQMYTAVPGYVNQTFTPFSTKTSPTVQLQINFTELEK